MTSLAVIGLGYVGMALAREATGFGLRVAGYDLDARVVASLTAGRSPRDCTPDTDVAEMLDRGFHASTDDSVLTGAQVMAICVPTPLGPDGGPDLTAVRRAAQTVSRHVRPDTLVVLESTTYPGCTDEVVRPLVEGGSGLRAGVDFHLAFSPERIDPGNPTYGLHNTPKIVGGYRPCCTAAARTFYGTICAKVVAAKSLREAEMAKLLENTYRHVNIALVNELAMVCRGLGVDIWDAIACASTKPFGFQAFYPGPGVGGHCIPVDPHYLSYKARAVGLPSRFVELAEEINSRMPSYVVERAADLLRRQGKPLEGASVLLLGVTYKPDVADVRESPAVLIALNLLAEGAAVSYHDPYVPEWVVTGQPVPRVADPHAAAADADLTLLLQNHGAYDLAALARDARLLFDTRGRVPRVNGNIEVL